MVVVSGGHGDGHPGDHLIIECLEMQIIVSIDEEDGEIKRDLSYLVARLDWNVCVALRRVGVAWVHLDSEQSGPTDLSWYTRIGVSVSVVVGQISVNCVGAFGV